MSALLALALALAPLVQGTSLAPALGDARVEAEPERVELGQPFELELSVAHRAGSLPEVDATPLEADAGWAVLAGGARTTLPDPRRAGDALTRVTWQVAALEPGARELPAPRVRLAGAAGGLSELEVARGSVEVRPVLAPGEDAPRPLVGFVGLEPEAAGAPVWPFVAVLLLAAGALLFVRARRRRAARAAPLHAPTPLELLTALEQRELDRPELVNAAHYELTRALRAHLDAAAPSSDAVPAAWTDEEWLAHAAERFDADSARRLELLFSECAAVKYGGRTPTHWAARERVETARRLAVELGGGDTLVALADEPGEGARS